MVYNVVLVPGVQQKNYSYTYTYIHFLDFFPIEVLQNIM